MIKPALTLLCGAALLLAANSWDSKDYTQWSGEDVNRILTDSPWAKKAAVSMENSSGGGGGRRGGMGMPGGGMGMPGSGGMGMPGGAGGGMGMPGGGGGMGTPGGGGGMGRNRGGQGPGMGGDRNQTVTVQWQSALPVQQALLRSKYPDNTPTPGNPNYTLDQPPKDYVIAVSGLRMPRRRSDNDAADDVPQDPNSPNARPPMSPENMRRQLMGTSHLVVKNRAPLDAEDVKIDPNSHDNTILIFFPRTQPISLDDKEVAFETGLGRMKIEHKFHVKDMKFQGKLAL